MRSGSADAAPATVLAVPVFTQAPVIDGSLGPGWTSAATVTLGTDFTNRRAADEPTTVHVAQDGAALDVAFDVAQSEPIVGATVTNGTSVISDDYVEVALSPNGPSGFQYAFYANARGARYQTSSENSSYAPPWDAAVTRRADGYTVTMRIPLAIIRSGGRTTWRAQFIRATVHANALDVWAYEPRAAGVSDATFFGTLTGIGAHATVATRPKPRAQIYGLGELTTRDQGGSTSRIGGDLALPVTPTASLVASFHPDFSNVETDQQTIAPTAFPRSFTEVRPFFTQAAQGFNRTSSCLNCPQLLYTPAIPVYRDAYALEGTQGPVTFDAFDAIGFGRDDRAAAIDTTVSTTGHSTTFNVQSVGVTLAGGIHDEVTSLATGYQNQHSHTGVYVNYGAESGTAITDHHQGTYYQTGIIYATSTTTGIAGYSHIGAQFAPFDAFVSQNDIDGPNLYFSKTVTFGANGLLHDIVYQTYDATFKNHLGQPSQNDLSGQINVDFRNLLTVQAYYNESAVRTTSDEYLPFDASGFLLGYKYATATPSSIMYSGGPYYHGRLAAWTGIVTLPVVPNIHLTFETDRDAYFSLYRGEHGGTQWLERATFDLQLNRQTQIDIGARRLFGPSLPVSFVPPDFTPLNAGNLSAAIHYLAKSGRSEIYLVYGDPNSLATTPALFLKYILYVGAPKGT